MFLLHSASLPRLVLLRRGSARSFAWFLPAMGGLWPACCIARFNVGQSSFQIADASIRIILIILI
jgi:hypothetical protein